MMIHAILVSAYWSTISFIPILVLYLLEIPMQAGDSSAELKKTQVIIIY